MQKIKSIFYRTALVLCTLFVVGLMIPQNLQMPVAGATKNDYNQKSYWAYPWGASITHKGVDIFSPKGTQINSATRGIVLLTGNQYPAGKYALVLGPKWRVHYYAHLHSVECKVGQVVSSSTPIGTVGNTGNAKGKADHLHYVVATPVPYPWRWDDGIQGWKKMFYLNPIIYLNRATKS